MGVSHSTMPKNISQLCFQKMWIRPLVLLGETLNLIPSRLISLILPIVHLQTHIFLSISKRLINSKSNGCTIPDRVVEVIFLIKNLITLIWGTWSSRRVDRCRGRCRHRCRHRTIPSYQKPGDDVQQHCLVNFPSVNIAKECGINLLQMA